MSTRGTLVNGEKVRQLRRALGYSQRDLANLADCTERTIATCEKGQNRIDLATITRVASALGVEFIELLPSDNTERDREVIERWHDAFLSHDLGTLLSLHDHRFELEMPNADGLPAAGTFKGLGQLREHLVDSFEMFDSAEIFDQNTYVRDGFVLWMADISFDLGQVEMFRNTFSNLFWLDGGLIVRRTVVANYDVMRAAYSHGWKQRTNSIKARECRYDQPKPNSR